MERRAVVFRKKTTIIVGAGCSREYGLPLGDGLRDAIADMLAEVRVREHRNSSGQLILSTTASHRDDAFNEAIQYVAGNHWQEWFKKAQTMSAGLRHASSIDRYLDIHRDDDVMVRIGKLAIARLILKAESHSSVVVRTSHLNTPRIDEIAAGPNWLGQLVLRMQEGVRRDDFASALTNLTFISFNYDRVIAHYLYHSLRTLADLRAEEASEMMKALRVFHPYGRLGRLPWEQGDEPVIPFGHDTDDPRDFDTVAQNLRIFTETIHENDDIRAIRSAVQECEQIIFLGFSFLRQNMDLLRPRGRSTGTRVFATTFGESTYNVSAAKGAITSMLQGQNSDGTYPFRPEAVNSKAGDFIASAGNLLAG